MNVKLKQSIFVLALAVLLPACSSVSVPNPFGSGAKSGANGPENATAYECEGNKRFYVRMLNNGNDAWLIYPDHEVNLAKAGDDNKRFTSGVITLVIDGASATLTDGEKAAYTGCKVKLKN